MSRCYRCGVDLLPKAKATLQNKTLEKFKSEEHIIPNFCGGFLTSSDLLCRDCNNTLGRELEGELADKMIATRLLSHDIDRDKQPNKFVHGKTEKTNTDVLISRKSWKFVKPHWKLNEEGEIVELRVKTESEALNLLKKLARNNPKIKPYEIIKKIEWVNIYLNECINFGHHTFGGKTIHRAMSKIALNYFLYKGYNKKWALDLIDYVIRDDIEGKFATPYYSFIPIHEIEENEISHILYLKGNSKKRLLYCYIELYNIYNFIVVINDEYTGDDFEDKSCYDVLKKIELDKKINLSLLYNPLKRMQYDQLYHDQHFQQIQPEATKRFNRFLRLLEKIEELKSSKNKLQN